MAQERPASRVQNVADDMKENAQHWETLQTLFHLAEESPEKDVDELLAEHCADPELRVRARALIVTGKESSARIRSQAEKPLRERIGPYTLVRRLGAGGIGTVYLVERLVGGAVQRSALKMLSRSAAGPFFTERFAREQYILASLQHANITHMLDAGETAEGHPYLVMEYVDGMHLDAFCDDRHLGIAQRLDLFLEVCEAIAYAHRNLVVHLDLKPSNILVTTTEGAIKVLDFGTSKLIQPDSLSTTTVMATPAYASPEQLLNEPVTTLCDIYGLGAILYELLAGQRPNQDTSVAVLIERSINEIAPPSITRAVTPQAAVNRGLNVTRLQSLLSGDLSTIVAKTLHPRPVDRYATVDELMADVRRYCEGRPILARPQTTTYRLGKFVRRNRKLVTMGAVALLAVLATSTYGVWRQEQAFRAGERALQMQTFMNRLFSLANSDYLGKPTTTVPEFLELGVKVLPDFIKDPADLRAAQLSLAKSMFANDDYGAAATELDNVIRSAKTSGDLGAEAEAEAYAGATAYFLGHAEQARILSQHAMSLAHSPSVSPSARVVIEDYYVYLREASGQRDDRNVTILQDAVDEARHQHLSPQETAEAIGWLAWAFNVRGRNLEGEQLLKENLAVYNRQPYPACDLAATYVRLGNSYYVRGDYPDSFSAHNQSYQSYQKCNGSEGLNTIEVASNLARDMALVGRAKEAIALLESTLPIWQSKYGDNSDRFMPYKMLSQAYLVDGQFAKSADAAQEALRILRSTNGRNIAQQALCELYLARALQKQNRLGEAFQHAQLSIQGYESMRPLQPVEKGLADQANQLAAQLRPTQPGPAAPVSAP